MLGEKGKLKGSYVSGGAVGINSGVSVQSSPAPSARMLESRRENSDAPTAPPLSDTPSKRADRIKIRMLPRPLVDVEL